MNPIKKLAGQTLVYGLSSIVPRILNYFLTPLYTNIFLPEEYGIVTDLYAYVVFLNIILTYGMETAFMRFSQSEPDKGKVYSTASISILMSTAAFVLMGILFLSKISSALNYVNKEHFILCFIFIIAFDTISTIPFVKLRLENKAWKFATFKFFIVVCNVILNVLALLVFPYFNIHYLNSRFLLNHDTLLSFVFISNVLSSFLAIFLLRKEFAIIKWQYNWNLHKQMLLYALPLMVAGFAGSINEAVDRLFIKYLTPESMNPMHQLGIYGANIKIAVLLTLFVQTFRFAAEPFFFSYFGKTDFKKVYSTVNTYFVIVGLTILLFILLNMNIWKYFIGKSYWEGLYIIPVLLLANLFLGLYFNFSFWYKIVNKTYIGAIITVIGAIVTIAVNVLFIPKLGYYAAALSRLLCYFTMTIVVIFWGQKVFPIKIEKRIGLYLIIAACIYLLHSFVDIKFFSLKFLFSNSLILLFMLYAYLNEKKLISINKYGS